MHKYTLQFGIYINIINPLNIAYNREVKVKVWLQYVSDSDKECTK